MMNLFYERKPFFNCLHQALNQQDIRFLVAPEEGICLVTSDAALLLAEAAEKLTK